MTPIRRNGNGMDPMGLGPDFKARLFLFLACMWPLWVLALFAASSQNQDPGNTNVTSPLSVATNARLNLRGVLDRVDIMGYGPTHPRFAVVVVGEEKELLISSVKSVFQNTDLNRIFLLTAILDGHAEDKELLEEMRKIDSGSVPHWHGFRPDIHIGKKEDKDGDDPHGHKVHVMFQPERQGLAASRLDAAEFIQLLKTKHEAAGLKSTEEDLILLFLEAGSQLTDRKWIDAVTSALIVPPPILGVEDENVAMKLANAVSFHSEGAGKRTSFDEKMMPIVSRANAADINLSSGQSYPTPALNGAAIALRLDTYLNLPAQDPSLMDAWPANLELALNLWLCADGIDILHDAEVIPFDEKVVSPLEPDLVARFAAVWMEENFAQKFLQAYSDTITRLDWETKRTDASQQEMFPKHMTKRCRSFEWYAKEINTDLGKVLDQVGWDAQTPKEIKETNERAPPKKEEKPIEVTEKKDKKDKKVEEPAKPEELEVEKHAEPPPEEKTDRKKPVVPLRPENLEIVQQAKPVDISFVDVSGGHKEHPHMGAKDENGQWGYIFDETALRKNPPQLMWEDDGERKACMKRDNNFRMMTERVFVDMEYDKKMLEGGAKRDKIFCLVYTIESGHKGIPNILETWGPKCDGFMVASNKTEVSIGAVNIPHEGPEEYNNIWQKVRSMWSYIYDNYYEKYDWFHIGGDDLFLLVENLRYYLESEEIKTAANGGIYLPDGTETKQTPLFLGRRFAYQGNMNDIFNSGGSGYTMNKAALKTLVVNGFADYFPHAHTFSEDTMVAKIFRKYGILPYDTKDADGGERYMPFLPGHHWGYHLPKDPSKDWYAKYSINIKEGPEHCSPKSLAFHYVKEKMMKRLFALAYNKCPKEYIKS